MSRRSAVDGECLLQIGAACRIQRRNGCRREADLRSAATRTMSKRANEPSKGSIERFRIFIRRSVPGTHDDRSARIGQHSCEFVESESVQCACRGTLHQQDRHGQSGDGIARKVRQRIRDADKQLHRGDVANGNLASCRGNQVVDRRPHMPSVSSRSALSSSPSSNARCAGLQHRPMNWRSNRLPRRVAHAQ